MFYKKKGIPKEGDIVLCTVKNILSHSVFVNLDEYENLEGMLHISEVSPGRIRNLRDYVIPGKKIVCKILQLKDPKHIDLSLRRVPMNLRNEKMNEYKQELKAERMLEFVGKPLNISLADMYKKLGEKAIQEYGSLTQFFQACLNDDSALKNICTEEKITSPLLELIKSKIKTPEVEVAGTLVLKSFSENGIKMIKNAMLNELKDNISISYMSAPRYRISVKSRDFKSAEITLKTSSEKIIEEVKKNGGSGEFLRHA